MENITSERLRAIYAYDPETGFFNLRKKRGNRKVSQAAGTTSGPGYRSITIEGKKYLAHRLAWHYVFGAWPEGQLDHMNAVKDDNRIANLRIATMSQNKLNAPIAKTNTSGVKNVNWNRRLQKWHARVRIDGKRVHLGLFESMEAAADAYAAAAKKHHGQFFRLK